MLGRNSYTREEFDHARSSIAKQIAAYKKLLRATAGKQADEKGSAAREAFEGDFANNMTLVLDRYFVHRVRNVAGKDGNPLNEVELICDSLMNNEGIFKGSTVLKYIPEQSVLKLEIGERISLTVGEFERLSSAFFEELERKFL